MNPRKQAARTSATTPHPTRAFLPQPRPGDPVSVVAGTGGGGRLLTEDALIAQAARTIRSMRRRGLFALVPLVAAGTLGALAGSVATGLVRVPRVSELETYRPDIITEIRASDGSTIARYAIERRILVSRAN